MLLTLWRAGFEGRLKLIEGGVERTVVWRKTWGQTPWSGTGPVVGAGGRADFAQGGGGDPARAPEAIEAFYREAKQALVQH